MKRWDLYIMDCMIRYLFQMKIRMTGFSATIVWVDVRWFSGENVALSTQEEQGTGHLQ